MKNLASAFLALGLLACGAPTEPATHDRPPGSVHVESAWAAPTPGGVDVAAGYLTIFNDTDADDRLVSASSPRATQVDLHEMSMDSDGVMRMRRMEGLDVPAGGEIRFAPGGMHLMFTGVTEPFVEGEDVPVQLTFEHAGAIDLSLPVRRGQPSANDMAAMP